MASFQYEKKDRGIWIFNKEKAPKGRLVSNAAAKEMIGKDGWVKSRAELGGKDPVVVAKPQAAVEAAVVEEKKLFSDSVVKSARAGEIIEFNEVFNQFSAKELEGLLVEAGLSEGLDLRKGLEKIRAEFKSIIKSHNDGIGAENG